MKNVTEDPIFVKNFLYYLLSLFVYKSKYKIRYFLTCKTKNVVYLIARKCCGKLYIGSAPSSKERFRIHNSDIITGKIMCGVASHLLNVCKYDACTTKYLQVQLIEHISVRESEDSDKVL